MIKVVKPQISNFRVIDGKDAWKEVVYSARVSGVPESVKDEDCFKMIVRNDYGSALEHIIIKFDVKMTKGNAPELLEHRIASHTGYSTRYIKADQRYMDEKGYEIIIPWHLLKYAKYSRYTRPPEKAGEMIDHIPESVIEYGEQAAHPDFVEFVGAVLSSISAYEKLLRGVPRESARYVLPFCLAVGIYHMTWNLRSLLNLLSLRLCVRASPEFRCLASQIYFNLVEQLPILRGLVGCRGFMRGVCPEEGVTGVRTEKQHPIYPPCLFKGGECFIPTRNEIPVCNSVDHDKAVRKMEKLFRNWAEWR